MTTLAQTSRRSMLAGAAAAVVLPAIGGATELSNLDEMIADWRMASEEAVALGEEADRILAAAELPNVEAHVGRRRFRYPYQVHEAFDSMIDAWEKDRLQAEFAPQLRRQRDGLIAELQRQEDVLAEAEKACGFSAADALADQACWQAHHIRSEIIAYRPSTMGEVATKNAFLLEMLTAGIELSREELTTVFGCLEGM